MFWPKISFPKLFRSNRLYTFTAAFWRKYSAIPRSVRLPVSPPDHAGHKEEIKAFGIVLHFPLKDIEQCQCRNKKREKLRGFGISFLKSPRMANARMPQFYGWVIATGELA